MKNLSLFLLLIGNFMSNAQRLEEGVWNGFFKYKDVNAPFSFEVHYQSEKPIVTIINGEERLILNCTISGDSIDIPLKPFDATLKAKFNEREMTGVWEKGYKSGQVEFIANYGGVRFHNSSKTYTTINKKLAVEFKSGTSNAYSGIGLFEQIDQKVTGTILTEVGDFRYFEGIMDGDSIKMSSFDGVHAFVFTGVKSEQGWKGKMYFENNYSESWIGIANNEASIQDPFEMVNVEPAKHKPYFDLLGAGSGRNAIDVSKYENKVVIIQIFGTWCPNSYDQTRFLVDWYHSKDNGVEVLASTYEPNYSKEYGMKRIADYKSDLKIPYEIYLGGQLSKSQAAFSFPFIERINAFPTLVILDKNGFARYVHSYFNGPATGDYFVNFKMRLSDIVNELLLE